MSLPELIPSNLPQFVRLTPRSAFANSVIPQGCVLFLAEPDGNGGAKFIYKKPDGSFSEIGGGSGSTPFYKCASVGSGTWSGYLASVDGTTGVWSYASTATAGRVYNNLTPLVGKVYADAGAGYIFEVDTGAKWIPQGGLLCSAFPDPNWVSGNSVSQWGDFAQSDTSKQPQLATIGGVVGIKAREGDEMNATATSITGDFTYLALFYSTELDSYSDFSLITDSQSEGSGGAIICFGLGNGQSNSDILLLSKEGVSADKSKIGLNLLFPGVHAVAVTYNASTSAVRYYIDGRLFEENSYSPGFSHSSNFRYRQRAGHGTSDNLILGLAAYNRVLSSAEIEAINW